MYAQPWKDYELIDAGGEKKLERWGKIITVRPERNAYFKPELDHQNVEANSLGPIMATQSTPSPPWGGVPGGRRGPTPGLTSLLDCKGFVE